MAFTNEQIERYSRHIILKEVGAKDLKELAQNPARSGRISQAFENQNKRYAVIQGAVTGLSGVIGAAIDVPTSIGLALHSIYQTGRAYGFELKTGDEQEIVEFIFKQIGLGLKDYLHKQGMKSVVFGCSGEIGRAHV